MAWWRGQMEALHDATPSAVSGLCAEAILLRTSTPVHIILVFGDGAVATEFAHFPPVGSRWASCAWYRVADGRRTGHAVTQIDTAQYSDIDTPSIWMPVADVKGNPLVCNVTKGLICDYCLAASRRSQSQQQAICLGKCRACRVEDDEMTR